MEGFISGFTQILYLVLLIAVGYILDKIKAVPSNTAAVLSILERNLLLPAMIMNALMQNFTVERLKVSGRYFIAAIVMFIVVIPIVRIGTKLFVKDGYERNICSYGLIISNSGYMGNAVISKLFPDIFPEFIVYALAAYILNYIWGVPTLLIPHDEQTDNWKSKLRRLNNPIFYAMIIGIVIGLSQIPIPGFAASAVSSLGSCMSPIAMLLTGMSVAQIDLKLTLKRSSIYIVSMIRLLVIPMIALLVVQMLSLPYAMAVCILAYVSMPIGLNSVVIPSAYGKDTAHAAAMVLFSHIASALTIPLVFAVYNQIRV